MGRVSWLVAGALATVFLLAFWEPPAVAVSITGAQVGTALVLGKLPFFDYRPSAARLLDSPISWGRAQFGFLAATCFWELQVGFVGGQATWAMSVALLLLFYGLARIGCLQSRCCRAARVSVDSRLVEIGLCAGMFVVLVWALFSIPGPGIKYLALASLAAIRLWFLTVNGERRQMRLEASGFVLFAVAFALRDYVDASQPSQA